MNKALPCDAVSQVSTSRGGREVLVTAFWASGPLLIGVCASAASWGQIGWWPAAVLAVVYGVCLLRARPQSFSAEAALVAEPEFAVSSFGVVSLDHHAGVCLPWVDVTQVDLVSAAARKPTEAPLFVELIGKNRKLVVPAEKAVVGQLLRIISTQLGALDEAQFLQALRSHGTGSRFTVWQRSAVA